MQRRAFLSRAVLALVAGLVAFGAGSGRAELIQIFPSRDAMIFSFRPDNAFGGAGWFSAGVTQNGETNRALLQFDIAAAVPTNARIIGAQLNLTVTRVPADEQTNSPFSLRRLLRDWGEGTGAPTSEPGKGVPAAPGDATWNHRFHGTNTWAVPGGAEGIDFSATVSGTSDIAEFQAGPYEFVSTPQMVADVQSWLHDPSTNFGWLLKTEAETDNFTARGFGSRELGDPGVSAQLIIDYAPAPQLASVVASNRIWLSFSVAPFGAYRVERCDLIGATNAWITVTNLGYQYFHNYVTVSDSLGAARRFYRVRVD